MNIHNELDNLAKTGHTKRSSNDIKNNSTYYAILKRQAEAGKMSKDEIGGIFKKSRQSLGMGVIHASCPNSEIMCKAIDASTSEYN